MSVQMKRFFIAWIVSSLAMFVLFYIWHGAFLNDFSRLNYPKEIFLIIAGLTYVFIGFVVVRFYETKLLEKLFFHKPLLKGVVKGALCGFIFFLIATVVGVSFNTGSDLKNMALDLAWQLFEQGIGGLVAGLLYASAEHRLFND
jgi:H+/Cl- antiporter ClcA